MKKNLIAFIAVGLMFAGCQEKQNPALSVNDITTFATLSGSVSYQNAIGVSSTGAALYDTLPLQNQMVEVKVDASMYTQNAWNNMCTFSGVTDAQGMFHIQVPVLASATNFTITSISLRPFYLQNYPIVTWAYVIDPVTGAYTLQTNITYGEVYCDGLLPFVALPATVYANHEYFCGNNLYMSADFVKVGL